MSEKQVGPETPDESIPQDPGIPGPGTKDERDWPPGSKAGEVPEDENASRDPEARDASASEAVGRTPRHRAEKEHEAER
jgi:hypothetical protein